MSTDAAPLKPPAHVVGPVAWIRENLFSGPMNSILTLVFGTLLLGTGFLGARFVFVTARWGILYENVTNVLVGLLPREHLTLVWICLGIVTVGIAFAVGAAHRLVTQTTEEVGIEALSLPRQLGNAARRFAPLILFIVVMLALAQEARYRAALLVLGLVVLGWIARTLGMKVPRQRAALAVGLGSLDVIGAFILLAVNVGWDQWGGLLLTLFLASSSIILCFPFGILAALGRRSTLPVMRIFSVGYIELIRGVPLITLLFMGSLMLRFFLPENLTPAAVTRAVVMITLFSGAYVAEIVRGGLQAVPQGQTEAAQALGLPATKMMRLIILPQALRNVIPALVGQFISLFKDTSLVTIIGLNDLLFVTQALTKQPEHFGTGVEAEVLAVAAFTYWVVAFTMSRESQRLEGRLGVGTR